MSQFQLYILLYYRLSVWYITITLRTHLKKNNFVARKDTVCTSPEVNNIPINSSEANPRATIAHKSLLFFFSPEKFDLIGDYRKLHKTREKKKTIFIVRFFFFFFSPFNTTQNHTVVARKISPARHSMSPLIIIIIVIILRTNNYAFPCRIAANGKIRHEWFIIFGARHVQQWN